MKTMNGYSGRKLARPPPPLPTRLKEKDEDLLLFRDMLNKNTDKEHRTVSLLQPVSDEFEPTGNYALFRMKSANKTTGVGAEFLGESEKNDYDWLKTPPATPLFPSLEMETNSPHLLLQREIPIMQPLSRFAGNLETTKKESRTVGADSKFQKAPPRSTTPIGKSNRISSISLSTNIEKKNTRFTPEQLPSNSKKTLISDQLRNTKLAPAASDNPDKHLSRNTKNVKPLIQNASQVNEPDLSSKTKSNPRGVSPQVTRPKSIPDRTPSASRVRTSVNSKPVFVPDRAISASRTRYSVSQSRSTSVSRSEEKVVEPATIASMSRGRKQGPNKPDLHNVGNDHHEEQKGGNVLGSRMVDKFLNARKLCGEERELIKASKGGFYGSINENSGFGRVISKSSLDMAVKRTDIKREPINSHQLGSATGRKFTSK